MLHTLTVFLIPWEVQLELIPRPNILFVDQLALGNTFWILFDCGCSFSSVSLVSKLFNWLVPVLSYVT